MIQLADCSTRQPVGILEDVPVRVGEYVIPCDFYVVDMEESPHMPIILGRPFLATAGAEINVQAGTLSFCICGVRVDFSFPPPMLPQLLLPHYLLQHLPLHSLQCQSPPFLPPFLTVLRPSMEMEDLTRGLPGMLLLPRSRPAMGSLLLSLGKFWTPLHHPTPCLLYTSDAADE